MATFLEQARAGAVGPDDIEAFVAHWHDGEDEGALRDVLGFTAEEYARWLRDPAALQEIIGPAHDLQPRRRAAV